MTCVTCAAHTVVDERPVARRRRRRCPHDTARERDAPPRTVALLCALALPAAPALAQEAPATPPSVTYTVDESDAAVRGAARHDDAAVLRRRRTAPATGSRCRRTGTASSSPTRTASSRPLQTALETPLPPLREHWISRGLRVGLQQLQQERLRRRGGRRPRRRPCSRRSPRASGGRPTRVYATGVSMGGHVVGAMIERFPTAYAGALPLCGVMGDEALYDYFLSHAAAAQTLAGLDVPLPAPADYLTDVAPEIRDELGYGPGVRLNGGGHQLSAVTERLSGGERPLFEQAFEFWSDTAAIRRAALPARRLRRRADRRSGHGGEHLRDQHRAGATSSTTTPRSPRSRRRSTRPSRAGRRPRRRRSRRSRGRSAPPPRC